MKNFYKNKKIFITGNTGFKGTWLSCLLLEFEAELCGYSDKSNKLFSLCEMEKSYPTTYGDIRDYEKLSHTLRRFKPDVVIHMAAQPLVIEGYNSPKETFDVNIMGTVNLMAALQQNMDIGSVVNVTTDKVYKNFESDRHPYLEEDPLGGLDPYSSSKSCSELVTYTFRESYKHNYNIATARAGNVIGGGDFAENRIMTDCIKAAEKGERIKIRNPNSIRPWQHVLEPLNGYLTLAKALYENETNESAFNFGPELTDCISVEKLADLFCIIWGDNVQWNYLGNLSDGHNGNFKNSGTFKESKLLTLDSSKAQRILKWKNRWNVNEAVKKTVEWHKTFLHQNSNIKEICMNQIKEFFVDV